MRREEWPSAQRATTRRAALSVASLGLHARRRMPSFPDMNVDTALPLLKITSAPGKTAVITALPLQLLRRMPTARERRCLARDVDARSRARAARCSISPGIDYSRFSAERSHAHDFSGRKREKADAQQCSTLPACRDDVTTACIQCFTRATPRLSPGLMASYDATNTRRRLPSMLDSERRRVVLRAMPASFMLLSAATFSRRASRH